MVRRLFGISVLMSFLAFGLVARLYMVPRLSAMSLDAALMSLVIVHAFRFVGLCFLVPGVVSESLPSGFAAPAAYGDLIAAILAIIATLGLANHAFWAIPAVWVFNIWGAVDLLYAIYQGQTLRIGAGFLGAAFFIPTAVVPPLLIIHGLIFWLLLTKH